MSSSSLSGATRRAGHRAFRAAGAWSARAHTVLADLAEHPRRVVALLAVTQWALILAFALTVRHNGWIYYQGGDQIWYSTSGSLLAHGQLPPTFVGYGWSIALAPIMAVFGPGYVAALPAIIALNVLVLGPLALAALHELATRIGGRVFALWAGALWVAGPFVAIPFWRDVYHERYVEQVLPQALGLTGLADFPSMVLLLVAAALILRSLDTRGWETAAAAGLVAGLALGIKPANALFLGGPLLAYALARRWRELLAVSAGLAPSLLVLMLWKQRGLGQLPLFALEEAHVALGATVVLGSTVGAIGLDRYIDLNWGQLQDNGAQLREFFWSARLVEWAPLAGAYAVARRSLPLAALLAAWLGAVVLVKGSSSFSTVESATFFRFLMPAYPAFLLLGAAIPLLLPRLSRLPRAALAPRPVGRRPLLALAALTVVVPALLIGLARPLEGPGKAIVVNEILTPVTSGLGVEVSRSGAGRTLSWQPIAHAGADVFYRVYRSAAGGEDAPCDPTPGSATCRLGLLLLGTTREPRWQDGSPPPGAVYRIGIAGNWRDDPEGGDVFAISPPINAG